MINVFCENLEEAVDYIVNLLYKREGTKAASILIPKGRDQAYKETRRADID